MFLFLLWQRIIDNFVFVYLFIAALYVCHCAVPLVHHLQLSPESFQGLVIATQVKVRLVIQQIGLKEKKLEKHQ
jgi:hypothetical protein